MRPCGHTTIVETCLACRLFSDRNPQKAEQAPRVQPSRRLAVPCVHLGATTGKAMDCEVCGGGKQVEIFNCAVHKQCTTGRRLVNKGREWPWCVTCKDYRPSATAQAETAAAEPSKMAWAYGVTTVPERFRELLPRTLASLRLAGFDRPRLFVDGGREGSQDWARFGLDLTFRWPRIRTHGNWFLSLHELFIRNPNADRYAIFQDDMVTYRNLRAYLEACEYPSRGYWNLYTFPENQRLAPGVGRTGRQQTGWYRSNGKGKGAVGLVFDRDSVLALLASDHMVGRPMSANRGHRAVDGGIVDSMRKAGRMEYVHNPSLVQHTGDRSSMGNGKHPKAISFNGEGFDAMELLPTNNRGTENAARAGTV